jgi:RHS repeat-associated protein
LIFTQKSGRNEELVSAYNQHLYDGLGNVVNTTDEAGRILQTYEYEAFGRVRNISFDPHNDFRSLGAYGLLQDDATDFRYNRARYYDAEIGRFISRDPIGIAGGINLYGYAGNNAVNWVDVDGKIGLIEGLVVGIVAGYLGWNIGKYASSLLDLLDNPNLDPQPDGGDGGGEECDIKRIEDQKKSVKKGADDAGKAGGYGSKIIYGRPVSGK